MQFSIFSLATLVAIASATPFAMPEAYAGTLDTTSSSLSARQSNCTEYCSNSAGCVCSFSSQSNLFIESNPSYRSVLSVPPTAPPSTPSSQATPASPSPKSSATSPSPNSIAGTLPSDKPALDCKPTCLSASTLRGMSLLHPFSQSSARSTRLSRRLCRSCRGLWMGVSCMSWWSPGRELRSWRRRMDLRWRSSRSGMVIVRLLGRHTGPV